MEDKFYFGASTSAHQVEGGNTNSWSEWEKENARRLATEAKKNFGHLANWGEIQARAEDPSNYISGKAADHYNRYEEDFDTAKSLGHNAHRFSIEWSRIEPEEGKFDENEIEHYRKVISALRARGMEPFVTLWHWPDPVWIRDMGGWKNKKIVEYFARYVQKITEALGNEVKFWITLNEPEIYTSQSYIRGEWPPQNKNIVTAYRVWRNLIEAHKAAYKVIKKVNFEAQIGIAKDNIYVEAYRNGTINRILKYFTDFLWNFHFLNAISNYQDFIGLNYYFRKQVHYGIIKHKESKFSDMGWELFPEGIYHALCDLKRYKKPVFITEAGLADEGDIYRAEYITGLLQNVKKALGSGVNVGGFLHWSLLDNFEWNKGFWPRFGLIEVDYKTMERKVRPSALAYKEMINRWPNI